MATAESESGCSILSQAIRKFGHWLKFAIDYYTKSVIMVIVGASGIGISSIAFFHAIGQWDGILMSRFMWGSAQDNAYFFQSLITAGYWRFAEVPFQDSILFRSNAGNGYDFFLILLAIGFVLAMVSMAILMFGVIWFYKQKVEGLYDCL